MPSTRRLDLFGRLGERRQQLAGTLSGGEQRMLTLARVLVLRPRLLVADELSLGLAPLVTAEVYQTLERVREAGCALLVVEQHLDHALQLADEVLVIHTGEVAFRGSPAEARQMHDSVFLCHRATRPPAPASAPRGALVTAPGADHACWCLRATVPAAVYRRRGEVELAERPLPPPGEAEGGGRGGLLRGVRLGPAHDRGGLGDVPATCSATNGAGTVTEVGPGVDRLAVGDRVLAVHEPRCGVLRRLPCRPALSVRARNR